MGYPQGAGRGAPNAPAEGRLRPSPRRAGRRIGSLATVTTRDQNTRPLHSATNRRVRAPRRTVSADRSVRVVAEGYDRLSRIYAEWGGGHPGWRRQYIDRSFEQASGQNLSLGVAHSDAYRARDSYYNADVSDRVTCGFAISARCRGEFDYESPALTAELQALGASVCQHLGHVTLAIGPAARKERCSHASECLTPAASSIQPDGDRFAGRTSTSGPTGDSTTP